MNSNNLNKELCNGCSECCKYIIIEINEPETIQDIDKLMWYLHHNTVIYVDMNNNWMLELKTPCKHLSGNGLCMIYDERPQICRQHSQKDCEKQGKRVQYKYIFNNYKELINYIRKHPKLSKIWKKQQNCEDINS